jgi:hypothetical protein
MKRRAKGTTRTGAIPFCMAEVTPRQSREARFDRVVAQLMHDGEMQRERQLLGAAEPYATVHAPYATLVFTTEAAYLATPMVS